MILDRKDNVINDTSNNFQKHVPSVFDFGLPWSHRFATRHVFLEVETPLIVRVYLFPTIADAWMPLQSELFSNVFLQQIEDPKIQQIKHTEHSSYRNQTIGNCKNIHLQKSTTSKNTKKQTTNQQCNNSNSQQSKVPPIQQIKFQQIQESSQPCLAVERQISKVWTFGFVEFRVFGFGDFWIFGVLIFGCMDVSFFGFCDLLLCGGNASGIDEMLFCSQTITNCIRTRHAMVTPVAEMAYFVKKSRHL